MGVRTEFLEMQADKIELTLQEFGVQGHVYAGTILPQVVVYQLQLGQGQRLSEIRSLREELALRLSVPGVLITRSDGAVHIEVPRQHRTTITFGWMLSTLKDWPPSQTALLGMAHGGVPLLAHFPSPNVAHVLIAGMTGAGKSELLRTMLVSLALWSGSQAAVYLIDPKGKLGELSRLRSVMQVCSAEMAPALMERLLAEMERRGAMGGRHHIYVVIDELADLVMVDRAIEQALTRLVQRGREADMHVIAATQRPSAAVIAGLMKANFPIRISGAVVSATEASIATGMPKTGAEFLLGKGDMILIYQGRPERFQVCMFVEEDWGLVEGQVEANASDKLVQAQGRIIDITKRLQERLGLKGPGRPEKGYTEEMVQFAMGQLLATGTCSQRALRRWHREKYQADVNPPRVVAAIEEAERRLGLSGKGQDSVAE